MYHQRMVRKLRVDAAVACKFKAVIQYFNVSFSELPVAWFGKQNLSDKQTLNFDVFVLFDCRQKGSFLQLLCTFYFWKCGRRWFNISCTGLKCKSLIEVDVSRPYCNTFFRTRIRWRYNCTHISYHKPASVTTAATQFTNWIKQCY